MSELLDEIKEHIEMLEKQMADHPSMLEYANDSFLGLFKRAHAELSQRQEAKTREVLERVREGVESCDFYFVGDEKYINSNTVTYVALDEALAIIDKEISKL